MTNTIVLVCAFRYALGRKTYVVGAIVGEIHKSWNSLSENDKELFVREISEYERTYGNLGHDCDRRDWMTIIERFKAEKE